MKLFRKILLTLLTLIIMVFTSVVAYADTIITPPTSSEVADVAENGIRLFFGALGVFAIIKGGIEFYGAFTSYNENKAQGGYGKASAEVGQRIFAGVMCLIGGAVAFTVMYWTLKLFGLSN